MTADRIDEIRERVEKTEFFFADIPWLLDEVEKLKKVIGEYQRARRAVTHPEDVY